MLIRTSFWVGRIFWTALLLSGLVAVAFFCRSNNSDVGADRVEIPHEKIAAPLPIASDGVPATADSKNLWQRTDLPAQMSLSAKLEQVRDYRVLFESLLQSKEPGAGLYAINILSRCARMRDAIFPAGSISSAQQTAQQLFLERCGSFSKDELSPQRRFDLYRDPRIGGNYLALQRKWPESQMNETQRTQILSEILQVQDPLLLEYIGTTVFYRSSPDELVFDGKKYSQAGAGQIFNAAWQSAICEATAQSCGTGDPYVVEICATSAVCETTRKAALQWSISERFGQEGVQLFESIYPNMVSSIKNQRLEAFRL